MMASPPPYVLIPLPGEGPEDVVVGPDRMIYTGLADGRVLAVSPEDQAVREVANTGGRPLGLEATADGRLLICDSPKGLLELDLKTGRLKTLVTHDGTEPLIFCSNVVAAPNGEIFFTVSSMRYDVHDWKRDVVENIPTGRVYRLAADGALKRLMNGVSFANGLVRTRDGSLIVAETTGRRLVRLRVAGTSEPIAELPGFPDNLGTDADGVVWVALASEPNAALERLHKLPLFLRRLAARLPEGVQPKPSRVAWVAAYDESGRRVHDFKWTDGGYAMVTGVCRAGHTIWCAGLEERALMRFDLPG
ncbi:MAG TPA: SMP-30/gluconolactonase/LRE family protein [Roseiarcus sp.]|nr:SMP-30/gluconolactonase/LRE family protein [Roseiarcus sp.]